MILLVSAALPVTILAAESGKYPAPRFPSYTKAPKSVDDVMPYARAIARQTTGLQGDGFGILKDGESVALVLTATAEDMVVQALKRAIEERGVKVHLLNDYELVGVSRSDAADFRKARRQFTSEQGYIEARRWIDSRFADPEVPKKWLKERRPDLYEALYPAKAELSERLKEVQKKLDNENIGKGIKQFLEKNPTIRGVFWGTGGTTTRRREVRPYEEKYLGVMVYDNRWTVMSKISAFPGDVWRLVEERTIEPIAWADRLHITDPEGTDLSSDLTEDMSERWARGVYQQGHLYMFPNQATGRFPYSVVEYPAFQKKWNARPPTPKANGVIAGTANHAGHFPRAEIIIKDGFVVDVKGTGVYAETWREFLKYPKINEVTPIPITTGRATGYFTKRRWGRIQSFTSGRTKTPTGKTPRSVTAAASCTSATASACITARIRRNGPKSGSSLPRKTIFPTTTGFTFTTISSPIVCGCAARKILG
jgi:hypothetical protein